MSDQGKDTQDHQYISPDDALILIQDEEQDRLPAKASKIPSPSSQSEHATLADQLSDQYGIAELVTVREQRSGSEALQSPEANQGDKAVPSRKASRPADQEDGGWERRGIEVEDVDALPDEE